MDPQLVEIVSGRNNPGIDPHMHIWGWEIPLYLFLGGLVAGVMILLPLLERRSGEPSKSFAGQLAPFAALGLLGIGMLALLVDLAYPTHVFRFYLAWVPTSPMSWGGWIVALVFPVVALLGLGGLSAELRSFLPRWSVLHTLFAFSDRHRDTILWSSLLVGVGLGTYTGLLLGTMPARPTWHSALLGPLFLTSGVSTGAALLMLGGMGERDKHALVRWDAIAIAVEMGLLAIWMLSLAGGNQAMRAAIHPVLGGAWTPAFWGLVVGLGLTVPLLMNLAEIRRHLPMSRLAPAFVLIGGFALRWILVAVGQETSLTHLAQLTH